MNIFPVVPLAIALGREPGRYVDMDLDCAEAVHFATVFAPSTDCIYGREKRPASHLLYRLVDGAPDPLVFKLPGGEVILEIRGKGQLSTLPGSIGPEGDKYVFEKDGTPSDVTYDGLKRRAAIIAIAVLCARYWPKKGSRNAAALALAGLFYKSGLPLNDARQIVWYVAKACGDEEAENRAQAVVDTWKKADSGHPVTGASILCELFGKKNVACLKEWLGVSDCVDDDEILEFNKEYAVVVVGNKCKILQETIVPPNLQKTYKLIDRNDFFAPHARM